MPPECKFYNTYRGCRNGIFCSFRHVKRNISSTRYSGVPPPCRFYPLGICRYGDSCRFRHDDANLSHRASTSTSTSNPPPSTDTFEEASTHSGGTNDETDEPCGICYDKVKVYGLLLRCNHVFCHECIQEWRQGHKSTDEASTTDKSRCPVCREISSYVIPSKKFLKQDNKERWLVAEKFKRDTGKGVCRSFQRSSENNRQCPEGRECKFQHRSADGSPYIFQRGPVKKKEETREAYGLPVDIHSFSQVTPLAALREISDDIAGWTWSFDDGYVDWSDGEERDGYDWWS